MAEAVEQDQLKEIVHPTPLLYCQMIVRCPHFFLVLGSLVHLSFVGISLLLYYWKYDVVVLVFDDIPLVDKNYEGYQCFKAMYSLEMSRKTNRIDWGMFYGNTDKYDILLYFDGKTKNVLNSKSLAEIYKVEVMLMEKLIADRMALFKKGKVVNPFSLTYLLLNINGNDSTFQNINKYLEILVNDTRYTERLSTITCSPLKKINDVYHSSALISVLYLRTRKFFYIQQNITDIMRKISYDFTEYWSFYYEDRETFLRNLQDFAIRDLKLTIGSLMYIYAYTYFQTKSVFLTMFGVTSVFTSFFIANFVHTIVLGIKFFGIFHVLAIYIIMGLGCDDMYVFLDHWKSNENRGYPSLAHRLSFTYRSANKSMLITSITTMVAFSIMIFTPLVVLSTFAIFTVLLVIVNYISVLVYFPTVIVVYSLHYEAKRLNDKRFDFLLRLFSVHYYNLLTKKYVKELILCNFAAITVGLIFLMSFKFEISDKFPTILDRGTIYEHIAELKQSCFKDNNFDAPLEVSLVSGVAGVNSTGCPFWKYKCQTTLIWDKNYDIQKPEVQLAMLKLCREMKNKDFNLSNELSLRRDNRTNNILCFISDMEDYFAKEFPNKSYLIPWNLEKFNDIVKGYPMVYKHKAPPNFNYSFESAMDFWLFQRYLVNERSRELLSWYKRVLYRKITKESTLTRTGMVYGLKLVASHIKFATTFHTQSSGYYARVRVFDRWIQFKNDLNKALPKGLNRFMVCSLQLDISGNGYFHWIWVQRIINSVVLKGIFIGILMAVPIIMCATMNFYETFGIILATILTAFSIVGILPLVGWKMGFLEGTNLTLIVGLSVDYIVHMGLAFNRSKKETKEERLKDMLTEMPISVINGAFSTLGACTFLFLCKVKFLFQFGFFLFITISFACFYALVFYPCFVGTFGPKYGVGKIPNILNKLRL